MGVERAGVDGRVVLFDLDVGGTAEGRGMGTVVRKLGKDGEEGDDGWIEAVRCLPFFLS